VRVKARTRSSQLVAIVALISLKLVTFFSSKQHARAAASSRQKESSYRVTNYSWMQRGKNLAFHISDLVLLAFHISLPTHVDNLSGVAALLSRAFHLFSILCTGQQLRSLWHFTYTPAGFQRFHAGCMVSGPRRSSICRVAYHRNLCRSSWYDMTVTKVLQQSYKRFSSNPHSIHLWTLSYNVAT